MDDFGFLIKKLSRELTGYQDRMLKPLNIRSTQLHTLMVIGENVGNTSSEMARVLKMDRTTFVRNLSPLLHFGYVIKSKEYPGLKKKHYILTKEGKDIVKKGQPVLKAANVKLGAYLSLASDLDLFFTCCQAISDHLEEVQRDSDEV